MTHLEYKVRADYDGVCDIYWEFILLFKSQSVTAMHSRENGHSGWKGKGNEEKALYNVVDGDGFSSAHRGNAVAVTHRGDDQWRPTATSQNSRPRGVARL